MGNEIAVKGLTVRFGETVALDNVTVSFSQERIYGCWDATERGNPL